MDESDLIVSSVEIIKDKLYFATLKGNYKPKPTKNSKYFNIEDKLIYESFFYDYGPYHLCHLYFFCMKLNEKLAKTQKSKKIVFYTSDHKVHRLNAAYLIGCFSIIYLNKGPSEVFDLLTEGHWELLNYRDASGGYLLFEITLLDVFEGLHKAFKGGFFNFERFNHEEYMYYEKVLNGDLNWIIPEKMLAFSGPHAHSRIKDDYPLHAPEHYHKYFKDNNVTTVVRLNQKSYNAKQFTEFGFEHYELFFLDGSVPSDGIVEKFNKLSEKAKGAIAVHCKAGLGRTGTLIACYMMKHHDFTACQAISWLRICRPGSVIGFQQNFLIQIQGKMLLEGAQYRKRNGILEIPKFKNGIYSNVSNLNAEDLENGNFTESSLNDSTFDDLENVPNAKQCEKVSGVQESLEKPDKNDFVSLNSIINSNKVDSIATRSMTTKARANTALVTAKTTYTASKNNFIISNINNAKSVRVQTTYTPKKIQTTTTTTNVNSASKSTFSFAKGTMSHATKVALTKSQYAKGSLYSQRANLARNRGQTFNEGGIMSLLGRKDLRKKSVRDSSTSNAKECDKNLNLATETKISNNNEILPPNSSINEIARKKIVLKKKPQKEDDTINHFLKKTNISNSDSELDSNGTPLTNMSADSLENIPCKMITRRDKSRSPEPTEAVINNGNIEEGVDSQGSKLCQIKATRKKTAPFNNDILGAAGVKTRNYISNTLTKKK